MNALTDTSVYVRHLGRMYRVTGVFHSEDACNERLSQPDNTDGVLMVANDDEGLPVILLADTEDEGVLAPNWL